MRLTVFIYFLIAGATLYGKFFSMSQIPMTLGNWLTESGFSPFFIMLIITISYWVLASSLISRRSYCLRYLYNYPIVSSIGFDGVFRSLYGSCCRYRRSHSSRCASDLRHAWRNKIEVDLKQIFKGVMPFVLAGFVMLVLLVLVPQIATFLPNLLYD
jgi:TRAP-type C4-dicarboxylate transport system permease large subunit